MLDFARANGATIFHPSRTCRMDAATDEMDVDDARLRVQGVGGLRLVHDACCALMLRPRRAA